MPIPEAGPNEAKADEAKINQAKTVHATCVLVGEAGILIRGASGAGKSALARELVALSRMGGRFARLVSDDRTRVEARHGRVIASAVAAIAGRIEIRGLGLVETLFESRAVVRLAIDLSSDELPRLPAPGDATAALCGVMVPRLSLRAGAASAPLVLAWLDRQVSTLVTL